MSIWDSLVSKAGDAVDGLYDSTVGAVGDLYDSAENAVSDWWNETEDDEPQPKSYAQQAQNERLAEGSALPVVHTATNSTGETLPPPSTSLLDGYQPWLIGGGVLVVVLLVFTLLLRGGK